MRPGNGIPGRGSLQDLHHPLNGKAGSSQKALVPVPGLPGSGKGRGAAALPTCVRSRCFVGGKRSCLCVSGSCLIWHRLIPTLCWLGFESKEDEPGFADHRPGAQGTLLLGSDKARGITTCGLCPMSPPPKCPVAPPLLPCLPPLQQAAVTIGMGCVPQVCGNCWLHGAARTMCVLLTTVSQQLTQGGPKAGARLRIVNGRSQGSVSSLQ